jgi:hypothetical protein
MIIDQLERQSRYTLIDVTLPPLALQLHSGLRQHI